MTETLKEQISQLADAGNCRAKASGQAFFVCRGRWGAGSPFLTQDPTSQDLIVAVCRPDEA